MDFPSISICIPTYNESKNVDRCLRSIFSKNYPGELDVMIVDGGSTDDTLEKVKKYEVRILLNKSKYAEIGKKIGLFNARGKYFLVIDCDIDLVGERWFERMLKPLLEDKSIVGSWSRYKAVDSDTLLNKFITIHPLQLDPMFEFLTPSYKSCVIAKKLGYDVLEYTKDRMLPSGFCLYRRKQLLASSIMKLDRFMENDNMVLLLNDGLYRYAVPDGISFHHPTLHSLKHLWQKRIRNVETMYFNQSNKRYWTWIDWDSVGDKMKLILWLVYCYSILPSVLVGIWKSIKYRNVYGMYELPFNVIATSAALVAFLRNREGRNLITSIVKYK